MVKKVTLPFNQQPETLFFEKRKEDNYYNLTMNTNVLDENNQLVPISIQGIVELPRWTIGIPFDFAIQENGKLYDVIKDTEDQSNE